MRPPPAEVAALPSTPTVIPQIQLATTQTRPALTPQGQQIRLLAPIPASSMATHISHANLGDLTTTTHVQRPTIVSSMVEEVEISEFYCVVLVPILRFFFPSNLL